MVAEQITVVQMLPELAGGGVERGTLELGGYLAGAGHNSIVISAGGRLTEQLKKDGSTHLNWLVRDKNPLCLKYIVPLRRLLIEKKVDILHLRSRLPAWIGYLAWKSLPAGSRPKLVTTFHGFYSINQYSAIMAKGERVIAISKTIAEHIKENYGVPEEKIVLIYRGVDENYFDPDLVSEDRVESLRQNWDIKETDKPIIMLPARLARLKGHEVFINSLAKIKDLNWMAVCVGDTQENPAFTTRLINQCKATGIADKVKFVGHCHDMPVALMISDLVVSASSIEPEAFGRVAIEAQAMAKPVIATAHGGSLETVLDKKTGWLVKPGDADSLAAALGEAVSDQELRKKYGNQGKSWVRKQFTTRKMCDQTLDLYFDLLKNNAENIPPGRTS